MSQHYDNAFAEDNVYGHVSSLVGQFSPIQGSYFLDFGCGYGRLAEVIKDRFGMHYVGLDVDEGGLISLKERGFDTMFIDLRDPEAAFNIIRSSLDSRVKIGAVCIIDTLEHLEDPLKALRMFRRLSMEDGAPLLVSVPNVTHRDIGLKLATGRFDYTAAGLLDHTHLQYFTEGRVGELMLSAGWHEVYEKDVQMPFSDQHFPYEHPILSEKAPLHLLMKNIRSQVDEFGEVNQFVRAYLPGPERHSEVSSPYLKDNHAASLFLSVIVRTQGNRIETLRESLLCLSSQTCQDFEVLVVGHNLDVERQLRVERVIADLQDSVRTRVKLVRVHGGSRSAPLNAGFENASGRYVVMFDDDDLVFGNWVETFLGLEKYNAGQLLRVVAVSQHWDRVNVGGSALVSRAVGGFESPYPENFDLVAHVVENRSPLHSLAFPRTLYSEMGFRFDSNLTTAEDWNFIIRVAPLTGVACSHDVGCIYRQWKDGDSSFSAHDEFEWRSNYFYTLRKINSQPLLLPAGAVMQLRNMYLEVERMRAGSPPAPEGLAASTPLVSGEEAELLEILRHRYRNMIDSKSWRYTAPFRAMKRLLRGKKRSPLPMVWALSSRDFDYLIRQMEVSSSWRWTRFLRALRSN